MEDENSENQEAVNNLLTQAYEILYQAGRRALVGSGIDPDTKSAQEALDWSAEAMYHMGRFPRIACPPDLLFREVREG